MKKLNLKNLKIVKYFEQKISNFTYHCDYLRVLNSPFKGLRLKWYFGKIQYGTPYFLPRKWVKMTQADCEKSLADDIERCLPKYVEGRTWEHYKKYKKPVPIKYFGFNATTLGWKTKWNEYRYEWSPCYSLVIFGKQLFVTVLPDVGDDCLRWDVYWETWLHWEYDTDKTKSKEERFKELVYKQSNTWGSEKDGWTDYYYHILNKKYLKLYEQILGDRKIKKRYE